MKRILSVVTVAALSALMFSACMKNGNQAANGAADSAKMTADANKEKTKQFYENVINAHKPDAMTQYCAETFEDHNPDPGMDGKGIANNVKNFQVWFAMMPDAHITVDN